MSKYTNKGVPWHSGIGANVSDCHTCQEVMTKAKLDWQVKKCELVAKMPFSINTIQNTKLDLETFNHDGHIYSPCPNAYATYRADKDIPLGIVKSKYEVVQNSDAFSFFNSAIGEDKCIWDRAGYFGYGEKIFVAAKLKFDTDVCGDPIENYLVFGNSHDGSGSVNVLFTPVRVFCTNCLNAALKQADSYLRIKHTASAKERLDRGAEILHVAFEHARSAQQLYEALAKVNMNDDAVMQYIANLNLTDAERIALNNYDPKNGYSKLFKNDYRTMEVTGVSQRKINTIVSMWDYYNEGVAQDSIIGTAWGAYNAVTGYYSNVANMEGEKRMQSVVYGTAANTCNKALNMAYDLVI